MDNKQRLQNIRNRITCKSKEYNLLDSWHHLMINYGWIPFEDFKKMDAYIVDELIKKINKMNEQQNKSMRGRR